MSSRAMLRCGFSTAQRRLLAPRFAYSSTSLLHSPARSFTSSRSRLQDARAVQLKSEDALESSTNPLLNPPETTRPPKLTLPLREKFESTPKYYYQMGRSYVKFFWQGLKSIPANRRLLKERLERVPSGERPSIFNPHTVPASFSRGDLMLLWRVRHDLFRVPLFGLMCCVMGEFTVFAVALVPGLVPYTCRIPWQRQKLLEKSEERRKDAFKVLEQRHPQGVLSTDLTQGTARKHVLRSLYISGDMWERLGFLPPGMWSLKGKSYMSYLESDDKKLLQDGAPMGLAVEELRMACMERGIDVQSKSETEMRTWLGDWLRLTAAEDDIERRRRMLVLLLTKQEAWPKNREFAVPDWEL